MRNFFLLSFLMFIGLQAGAQNDEEAESGLLRARLSVGLYSSKDIYTSINYSDASAWGKYSAANYFLDLSFYRYKSIELGIGLGLQTPQPKRESDVINEVYIDDNTVDVTYVTVLPQIRFNWIQSDDSMFEMYSSLGLGITITDADYSDAIFPGRDETFPLPAAHATWIGMRFGGNFGGFIELGLGTKGLIAAGVSYRM